MMYLDNIKAECANGIKKTNYTFDASLGEGNCVTELNELMSVCRLIHAITV